jgi:hypothetical protein
LSQQNKSRGLSRWICFVIMPNDVADLLLLLVMTPKGMLKAMGRGVRFASSPAPLLSKAFAVLPFAFAA